MSFRIAFRQAETSQHEQHRVGSVVVKNGRVLAVGHNSMRWTKELQNPSVHAEEAAVLQLLKARKLSALSGADIYVTRYTKGGRVGLAKPCERCDSLLRSVGIRNVYYTMDNGDTGHYKC